MILYNNNRNFTAETKSAVAIGGKRNSQCWVALWSEKGRNNDVGIKNNSEHIGNDYFLDLDRR